MIRIVRPLRKASHISAEVFDNLFIESLGKVFDLQIEPLISWCDEVLGPVDAVFPFERAACKFREKTKGIDYFCPGYELIHLAPLFIALRNASRTNVRLLFIAHACGGYVTQFALLRPLLVPGDLIIAPSESGKKTIEFLVPELSPYIRVIHHPMNPLSNTLACGKIYPQNLIVSIS